MKAYLRIEQISGAPDNEYYRDSRVVTACILPNDEKTTNNISKIQLNGLDTLQTNHMWSFNINDYENQSLVVTVSETKPEFLQMARLNLPLCWFPIDKQVNESYPMRPIVLGLAPLVALLDIHLSSDSYSQPFRCGFSSLLFEPGWRPPSNKNIGPKLNPVSTASSLTKKSTKLLTGKRLLKLGDNNKQTAHLNDQPCLIENHQSHDFSDGSVEMDLSSSSSDFEDGNDKYSGDYSSSDEENEKDEKGNYKKEERPGYAYFSPGGSLFPVATFSIKPASPQKREHKHRHRHRHHHHRHSRHRSSAHRSLTQPQQQQLLQAAHQQKHKSHQIPIPNNEPPPPMPRKQIKSAKSMDVTPAFEYEPNKALMSSLQIQQFKDTPVISSVTNLCKGKEDKPLPRRMLSKERFSGISEDKKASINRLYRKD